MPIYHLKDAEIGPVARHDEDLGARRAIGLSMGLNDDEPPGVALYSRMLATL